MDENGRNDENNEIDGIPDTQNTATPEELSETVSASSEEVDCGSNIQAAASDGGSNQADISYTVDDRYSREAPFQNSEGSFDSRETSVSDSNGNDFFGAYGQYGTQNGSGNGQFIGGFYPPPQYRPQNQGTYKPDNAVTPKKSKAPIIVACSLLVVFMCAVAFLFGYVYLQHIRPIIDGTVDGGGSGTGNGSGEGGDSSGGGSDGVTESGSLIWEGFDLVQPDTPGATYNSLADAYEATHKAFVEINCISNSGSVGAGSGAIIARLNGNTGYYIVTNYHVVEGAEKITVKAYCGNEYKEYTAHETVFSDEMTDLAVITIMETAEMQIAKIGKSSNLRVGEPIYVIGNPLGTLAGTMTNGIISAQAVEIFVGEHYMELLQTNAAINPGNSGGPMFNMSGELVGIVNAKYADVSVEGIGFAIPIDIALPVVEQMISKGYVEGRHDLGISVEYGYYGAGLWITGIDADSALRDTDMKISSVYAYRIEAINGNVFESTAAANIYLDELKAGDTVKITITIYELFYGQLRRVETKQLSITLGQKYAS